MNWDARHKAARLYGLALQIERGELDQDFAELGEPIATAIAERLALMAAAVRQLAAQIEGRG